MKKIAFYSIAYYLSSDPGHFLHYHKAVEKAVRPFVDQFGVYISRNNTLKELPKDWQEWFHPFNSTRKRRKFWKDCVQLFRRSSKKRRIFFLEFFSHRDFVHFTLAALLFSKRDDQLWLLYREDLTSWKKRHLFKMYFLSKALSIRLGKRFRALVDNDLLGKYYEKWFAKPLDVLPILHTCDYPHSPPQENKKLIFSWLGGPAPAKGLKLISQLVKIDDPTAEKIQLSVSETTPLPKICNKITVHLRKEILSEDEYYASLFNSDAILLPYDPKIYKWRSSGIFVEAITAGKVPLVHEKTWMASELKKHNLHELIVDWNHPCFFSKALALLENKLIRLKLEKMQLAYKEMHNEQAFSRKIQTLIG